MKPGDEVFSDSGQAAQFVGMCGVDYIVVPIWEHPDTGEPHLSSDPQSWHRIYDKPPVAKLDATVQELNDKIRGLRLELTALEQQKRASTAEMTARMQSLTRHEKLRHLEDFLDGKITHYALINDYDAPAILDLKNCKAEVEPRLLRLLCLYGRSNGDITWGLNRYADGSDRVSKDVVPCRSREEAVEVCQRKYADICQGARDHAPGTPERRHAISELDRWHHKGEGIITPDPELAGWVIEQRRINYQQVVEGKKKELAAAEAEAAKYA